MAQYPAVIDLSALTGSTGADPGFQISGEAAFNRSGWSVASAGDVNGDGFADLIIGAYGANASYVVFGKASGFAASLDLSTLDGTNGFQVSGEAASDFSGKSVASAGDVNGDGFADLIIGALGADPNGSYSGASYVVFGKASGFAANLNLSTLDGTNGFQVSGEADSDRSGSSVASAGDVNGDGLADFIIGAVGADPNGSYSGASYVVFGKASGFAANLNLSTLDGSNGFQVSGEAASDFSGFSVVSAGDVNGDSFADLIIGALGADPNGSYSGASYVVFGKASGFAANLDLSTLDGTNGFQVSGVADSDRSGFSVASAGDVNGDGFADLIIGAYGADPNGSSSGASYVVFGKASGFAANLNLSTLDGSNGFQVSGEAAFDRSGRSVASAGDVNGDGFADLIIGAYGADPNAYDFGASYVVFGKASGFAANLNLSTLDGSNGFQVSGEAAFDRSGRSVASAGDVNGDGFADLIIGAQDADPNGDTSGASYVVLGRKPDTAVTRTGTLASQTLAGGDFNDTLSGLAGDDVLWGHDGDDSLDGGSGNDLLTGGSGADILIGGDGNDTLQGGTGNDTFEYGHAFVSSDETVDGGGDTDTILFTGNSGLGMVFDAGLTSIERLSFAGVGALGEGVTIGSTKVDGGLAANLEVVGSANTISLSFAMNTGDALLDLSGFTFSGWTAQNSIFVSSGGSQAETIIGSSQRDQIFAGGDTDILSGGAGNDDLFGEGGDDTLDGGTGADLLTGGTGNDTYDVDVSDTVTENAGQGTDTARSSTISLDLANYANVENLTLLGASALDLTGDGNANVLTGNSADNALTGSGGNDTLDGGAGNDTLIGGLGIDTAIFSGARADYTISEINGDITIVDNRGGSPDGTDTLTSVENAAFSDITVSLVQFPGVISLASLTGSAGASPGVRFDGIDPGDKSGFSVASAGDVNGDGFADVIIGTKGADPDPGEDSKRGETYVVFGKASGFAASFDLSTLDGTNGFRLGGIDADDFSGWSVASAGDVNGDGFADVIIGAYKADFLLPPGAGQSYVVFGKASGFAASLELSSLDGTNGFRLNGINAYDFSGWSVASAGDVNGDGFADVIIGAYKANGAAGESYVVFGKASGFSASVELSTLDGSNGFSLPGIAVGDRLGRSVASAGDVNGDGIADIIIGASGADPNLNNAAGESYVVFGKASGFAASLDLSTLNGTDGFRLTGIDMGDYSGRSVASAGDINGDGFADFIVGAPYADPGSDGNAGESYVVFGKADWSTTAVLDLSTLDGTNGFRLDGIDSYDNSGHSVASAGDVNGDGFADLIIGALGADPVGNQEGESYVVFGKASGFAASLDLSTLDGTSGFRLEGIDFFDQSGRRTASAGDVNGDGFSDLIIAAYSAAPAGESYVVFGRKPDMAVVRTGTVASQTLAGGDFGDSLSGLGGDDVLWGHGGEDQLIGGLGNDTLIGGSSGDQMIGGEGNDTYDVDDLGDTVLETPDEGTDTVRSSSMSLDIVNYLDVEILALIGAADLNLTGDGNLNILRGNSGANLIIGGGGVDTMTGGTGNDTYDVDVVGELVVENIGEGDDTVRSGVMNLNLISFVNIENLALTGIGNFNLIGDGNANILTGNSAVNTLTGLGGDDTLVGGAGADFLIGGLGNDTYVIDVIGDKITELAGQGTDTLKAAFTITLGANLENLTLTGVGAINGTGNTAANLITGNAKNNTLDGGTGDDIVEGRAGDDILKGGSGNDTVSYANAAGPVIISLALTTKQADGDGGMDTLATFENLAGTAFADTLTGTTAANVLMGLADNDILIGGSGNDTLDGGTGKDSMTGGLGNDTYVVDDGLDTATELAAQGIDTVKSSTDFSLAVFTNVENLTLTGTSTIGFGNALANVLTGNSGSNTLDGGGGNDTLDGGAGGDFLFGGSGNDIYVVDDLEDLVDEAGTDTADKVRSLITITALAAGIENLDLIGTAVIDGTGNSLANTITGNAAANTLEGGAGDGQIDKLLGGLGNDTYLLVDSVTDIVTELASQGIDTVQSALFSYTLGVNVENLVLLDAGGNINGTGNTLANVITSNVFDNIINGSGGLDFATYETAGSAVTVNLTLVGQQNTIGAGLDTLVMIENLRGSIHNDTLTGSAVANVLDGGLGADTMTGLAGDDTYIVDDPGDKIFELITGGTKDKVQSTIPFNLGDTGPGDTRANVENLDLLGTDNIDGTGNLLINIITGNSGDNILSGGAGDAKADTLIGGLGNDTFIVEVGDKVTEAASGGTDTVQTTLTTVLGLNVENLTLTGGAAVNGTGNTLNNVITGNAAVNVLSGGTAGNDTLDGAGGNDTLNGGTGNDTLTGGADNDVFLFNTALSTATVKNVDTITDFVVADDTIRLENGIFTALTALGELTADKFQTGAAANDAADRIIYDNTTGALYYDKDGTGVTAQVQFATLSNLAAVTNADFVVI